MPSARRGRSTEGRAEVRRDLVAAAVHLFTERGYDETTIDDIAVAAGVGRRTFFRYFPSKEDAISPDHETALARVAEVFTTAHPDEPTTSLVLRAGETVFDLYTEDPELSVRRFALARNRGEWRSWPMGACWRLVTLPWKRGSMTWRGSRPAARLRRADSPTLRPSPLERLRPGRKRSWRWFDSSSKRANGLRLWVTSRIRIARLRTCPIATRPWRR